MDRRGSGEGKEATEGGEMEGSEMEGATHESHSARVLFQNCLLDVPRCTHLRMSNVEENTRKEGMKTDEICSSE